MQIHESAENYLETILILSKTSPSVRSIDIVNELGYSKPSVSVAMKKLRENGYITMDSTGYITLNESGYEIANRMYERHTVLTDFFKALGVDPDIAVEDACRVEHVISKETFDVLKEHVREYIEDRAEADAK